MNRLMASAKPLAGATTTFLSGQLSPVQSAVPVVDTELFITSLNEAPAKTEDFGCKVTEKI